MFIYFIIAIIIIVDQFYGFYTHVEIFHAFQTEQGVFFMLPTPPNITQEMTYM